MSETTSENVSIFYVLFFLPIFFIINSTILGVRNMFKFFFFFKHIFHNIGKPFLNPRLYFRCKYNNTNNTYNNILYKYKQILNIILNILTKYYRF